MASTTKVLRFTKTTWNQPIVCRLASDYGLTFNILNLDLLTDFKSKVRLKNTHDDSLNYPGDDWMWCYVDRVLIEP